VKTKKINIYYIFIICFSSILMFGCKFFNKPMDVYLEKYTKEIFVEDYKFDNEWISTLDGSSIVIQPGTTNIEVIIFNSMGVELNPKLEVVSGNWNEDSKFSANSSANNLIFSCKLENIEEGNRGVLQLSWPTKDGLRTFAPYNFPKIICNAKPPTPVNLQVGESNLSWSLDATVGNSIEDDLVQIDILLSQEGASSYTTNSFYRGESGWESLTVSDTNYTYTLAETEKRANTEFAVVVYDKHGQKSVNSTEGFLAKAAPKTEKDETTGATIHLIESSENMLWLAWELKVGAMTSFNIKLTKDIVIPEGEWQFSQLNMSDHSTIDGQGHSITIKEDVSKFGNSAGGLFYKFNNSTVKNLVLKGSITANTSGDDGYIGALCRSAYKTTIQNVMSTVEIIDKGSGSAGGLVGYFGGNGDKTTFVPASFIKNCAVYANISSTNGTAGGLVGKSWANEQTWKIENCIYRGTVSSGKGFAGALIGNENTGKLSYLTDIWYCESNGRGIFGKADNGGNIEQSGVYSKTTADIATAGAAALLGDAWEYVSGDYPTLKSVVTE